VAIHALLESEGLFEVSVGMTLGAVHTDVLAFERELGFRVVEPFIHRLDGNLLPAVRVVTGLAALGEAAVMRVLVAIRALVERNSDILRLAISAVGVALGTFHLGMQSGERVSSLRVIELPHADHLPVLEVVACLAGRAETAFVLILMTAGTCC